MTNDDRERLLECCNRMRDARRILDKFEVYEDVSCSLVEAELFLYQYMYRDFE